MYIGAPPFYHPERELLLRNIRSSRLRVPADVPGAAADLIAGLLEREPALRLGARETADVQDHAFFAPVDFGALYRREIPPPDRAAAAIRAAEGARAGSWSAADEAAGRRLLGYYNKSKYRCS